jgi:hypothetical protein
MGKEEGNAKDKDDEGQAGERQRLQRTRKQPKKYRNLKKKKQDKQSGSHSPRVTEGHNTFLSARPKSLPEARNTKNELNQKTAYRPKEQN